MSVPPPYSYRDSLKSAFSDEPVNTYLIRPLAGLVVWALYRSRITPNAVTVAAIVVGLCAAALYMPGRAATTVAAGLCLSLKDILDSADGQLARATGRYSRAGRFLDSVGDFVVTVAVFAAITIALTPSLPSCVAPVLGLLGCAGTFLRVSYHVYYHTSFLHLEGAYTTNRVSEELREDDAEEDAWTRRLHLLFLFLFGWQDAAMVRIDRWCRQGVPSEADPQWYGDRLGIRWSGFLGLGTEMLLLTLFSLADALEAYLWVNVVVVNLVWGCCVFYRRYGLARRLAGSRLG